MFFRRKFSEPPEITGRNVCPCSHPHFSGEIVQESHQFLKFKNPNFIDFTSACPLRIPLFKIKKKKKILFLLHVEPILPREIGHLNKPFDVSSLHFTAKQL